MIANIFITGFSGTGKTTVGREVAGKLGWGFVDTDDEIVAKVGRPIEAVFGERGEDHFRRLERQALEAVCRKDRQVVSTGGGVVIEDRNRALMRENGVIVCLEATPETIHRRLETETGNGHGPVVRPLLVDSNPTGRIAALKAERQRYYAQAHWTVHTDRLTPPEVSDEVVRAYEMLVKRAPTGPQETVGTRIHETTVRTSSGEYPIWVGWGILDEIGQRVADTVSPGAAYVVTDEGAHRHARRAQLSLEAAGVPAHIFIMPPGERSKSLDMARHVYAWLAELRAERGHLLLAVGGGVVGDLAGFAAATYLRGMPFAQAPTTLLAMIDAAVGGKTGVDLPEGKNLVGAFHQPRFVLEDVRTLETLPDRERRSGWAEAIKHGLILDEGLVRAFENSRDGVLSLDGDVSTNLIRRSVAIKADVVTRDERETLGVRVLLNYGHTIGHAIEAATGYDRYLHGEAVSIGMTGAAMISEGVGLLDAEAVDRQRQLLEAYGLPTSSGGVDGNAVASAMLLDKKTTRGAIRWVLLERLGRAVARTALKEGLVDEVLRRLAPGNKGEA